MAVCKSCKAPIFWAKTEFDKLMPVDAKPKPNGNVIILTSGKAKVLTETQMALWSAQWEGKFYTSHFATCSGKHRRKK